MAYKGELPMPKESAIRAATLLPHTLTARLLISVLRYDQHGIEAIGEIPADHPLADGGFAPNLLGLELGAQAAAAHEALTRQHVADTSRPKIGYLVRARHVVFSTHELPVAAPFVVKALLDGAAPPMAMYRITVSRNEAALVSGEISTYSEI